MGVQKVVQKIYARILLRKATMENTPEYALKSIQTVGRALQVYDGDTLWLAFVLDHKMYRTRVRMYGYDSPELKPNLDTPNREQVIEQAITAKKRLEELVNAQETLDVHFLYPDKYGRPLVKLNANGVCINDQMLQEKMGCPYTGGTKI